MQFLIISVDIQQFIVRATFHDASFMQHTDLVGILDGRETMGDSHCGTGLHQPFKSVLYQTLTLRIQSRCRLIENQDRRILQDGPCDTYTLTLTTTQPSTAVSDVCVKLSFRSHDEIVGIGNAGSLLNLFVSGIVHTKGDIVAE